MKEKDNLLVFALAAHGNGISGGDRILIEFIRRWRKGLDITVYQWAEGKRMFARMGLQGSAGLTLKLVDLGIWPSLGFFINYLARIFAGIKLALTLRIDKSKNTYIYSASEFWMDTIPAVILKIRYPKSKWIATWFQTAPNPLVGFAEGNRIETYRISALFYWLSQLPIKPLVKRYADSVLVNNESERKQFSEMDKRGKVGVVIGAVNTDQIKDFLKTHKKTVKQFDGIFQGRFHPQKGVVELIDIWKEVVAKIPGARLAMMGDGPLMGAVKARIKELGLEKSVVLLGYLFDGEEKYKTFQSSKVVVHPAFYDSGGMASAEAMAFGLPCVGFDLVSYQSYYPKGMIKARIGDLDDFADKIINLLRDRKLSARIGKEALEMINSNWSWDQRSEEISQLIFKEN